jgi:hypothetical protein
MSNRFVRSVTLLAFTVISTIACAQDDPPARVGRVSLAQGNVSISGDVGEAATAALVNWPVTSQHTLTTAANGRTEVRIGSTSVRLDNDSSLEVTELGDDSLRLRLHYGSASIRIVNLDLLDGFELATPQARVRMQQPGRLRVDAGRAGDTSVVSVFDGQAVVDGGGLSLTVRAGRSAELAGEDIRTGQARRDDFDEWALARDKYEDDSRSSRYVTTEMTGYEDLDRHGSWRAHSEYGNLWFPSVASSWVPYRDGRWTWISPWGWTWVDNAPWGYAPFHYGRWVHVNQRWAWAPGRHDRRPVWSPALVGWIGGSGWNLTFQSHHTRRPLPAQGWYPLSPHERFVPGYRLSDERLRRLHHGWSHGPRKNHGPDYRRRGVTVVPHEHFGKLGQVVVPEAPQAVPAPLLVAGPASPPPPPLAWRERDARRDDGRDRNRHDGRDRWDRDRFDGDRFDRGRGERDRFDRDHGDRHHRGQLSTQPAPGAGPVTILTPPPGTVAPTPHPTPRPPVTITTPAPVLPGQAQPAPWPRQHHPRRDHFEDGPRQHHPRRDHFDDRPRERLHRPTVVTPPPPAPLHAVQAPPSRPGMPAQPPVIQHIAPPPAPAQTASPPPAPSRANPMAEQRRPFTDRNGTQHQER